MSPIPPLSFLPPNQIFEVTDPTPNPSPTREGRAAALVKTSRPLVKTSRPLVKMSRPYTSHFSPLTSPCTRRTRHTRHTQAGCGMGDMGGMFSAFTILRAYAGDKYFYWGIHGLFLLRPNFTNFRRKCRQPVRSKLV